MPIVRFLLGLSLAPLCVAVTQTALSLLQALPAPSQAGLLASPLTALGGGFGLWLLVFFTLPRPVRSYVLAHELTHALWGALMGATVLGLNVSRQRGSVTLSRSNFFVTLAPYFFPLYTVLAVLAYFGLSVFVDLHAYRLAWLGLVGLTWGFHFTFTVSSLLQHQTDIQAYGRLLSYTVIYAMNGLVICLGVVLVSPSASLEQLLALLRANLIGTAVGAWHAGRRIGAWLHNKDGLQTLLR